MSQCGISVDKYNMLENKNLETVMTKKESNIVTVSITFYIDVLKMKTYVTNVTH